MKTLKDEWYTLIKSYILAVWQFIVWYFFVQLWVR